MNRFFPVQATLQRDIGVREDTIAAKERGLAEIKKETNELEKLRAVLTYKLNEAKEQLGGGRDFLSPLFCHWLSCMRPVRNRYFFWLLFLLW